MKVVAIIPIKVNSERVNKKNFRLINDIPLYEHFLNKLGACNFDEIYIDTNSKEVKEFAEKNGFFHIVRLPNLAKSQANGNDLLNYHVSIINADLYFQLFITSPLLRPQTINKAINKLKKSNSHDSIFTATKIYSWFWHNNKPVNYDPKILPRSQDAVPIIRETTGLYGIKRDVLLRNRCRIGNSPYMLFVDEYESADLDTEFDFQYVNFLIKNKLY